MNLHQIYTEGGIQALRALAEKVDCSPQYLYQCATGWNGKRPSPDLAMKLVAADPRLTLTDIYQQQSQSGQSSADEATGETVETPRNPATAACLEAGGEVIRKIGVSEDATAQGIEDHAA